MVRQFELIEKIQGYRPLADEALINRAYVYAMQKHGPQKRASGEPYMSHPHAVADILADLGLDDATIAVGLLHDTIEDTDATKDEIVAMFGEEIGELVEALTKLKKLKLVTKQAKQAENLRRFLLATSKDVRVLLVKLADRLHNMRTLEHMRADQQRRIAEETMEIYAPLAGRMGMQDMREELEDLSFRYINPSGYATIVSKLEGLREKNRNLVEQIKADIQTLMEENGIDATVSSRQKRPWSVFRKMETRGISFDALPDIFGFRIFVETPTDCYKALGMVHQTWSMVPGRFKDYISTPKQNDYQSIHTTVFGPSRQRIEIQIRTRDMHRIAEYGIAAHTLYKDGIVLKRQELETALKDSGAFNWLRQTLDALSVGDQNAEDFLEHTKLELFQDQVFTFTPKGRLIALPRGATPIDFAYDVHTDVGDTCIGCRINGRNMPLMTQLRNGDEVQILRSATAKPSPAWEQIAKTGKARAAIRRANKLALRDQYFGTGARILETAFKRYGRPYSEAVIEEVLPKLGRKDVADVLTAVGLGEMTSNTVLRAVHPELENAPRAPMTKVDREDGWFNLRSAAGMIFRIPGRGRKKNGAAAANGASGAGDAANGKSPSFKIRGVPDGTRVQFAEEGAVPGDRIVGILQGDAGLRIYPIHSAALEHFENEPERWIDVRWDVEEGSSQRFPAQIVVTAINAPGTLAKIAELVARHDVNIHNMQMRRTAPDFTEMEISVEVLDVRQLNTLLSAIKMLECVSSVERATAPMQ